MRKSRVLLVQPQGLQPPGGGNAVAAVMAEVLAAHYDVTLLTWDPVPWDATNRYYGTSLRPDALTVVRPSRAARALHAMFPLNGALLKILLTMRRAQQLAPYHEVVISSGNEIDAGCRAIQYIHFPWGFWPRPEAELRWFHKIPGLLPAYYALASAVVRVTPGNIAANRTLTNSAWTGEHFRRTYGGEFSVMNPPIVGTFKPREDAQRTDTFVMIGRISAEKRIEDAVAIVEGVRARTRRQLRLRVFGSFDDPDYGQRVKALAAERDWMTIEEDVSREDLLEAAGSARFGIHAMRDEHFGMAVAELVRSECVTFAHASGGPREILGREELLFTTVEDAIAKISAAVEDDARRKSLGEHIRRAGATFTYDTFRGALLAVVEEEIRLRRDASGGAATVRASEADHGTRHV